MGRADDSRCGRAALVATIREMAKAKTRVQAPRPAQKDRMGAGLPMRWAVAALVVAIALAGALIVISRHGADSGSSSAAVTSGSTLPTAAAVQRTLAGIPQHGL